MQQVELHEQDFRTELLSDFNEAKYQIFRIHLDLLDCRKYAKNGDLTSWKWTLDHIWLELAADARAKGGKNNLEQSKDNPYFKKIEELDDNIAKVGNNRDLLYKALQQKEIFLRFLQDDVGKGGKRSPTDEDEFD